MTTADIRATVADRPAALSDVTIDDRFWTPRIERVRECTIPFQYHQLETIGHLESLTHTFAPGDKVPHIFWDSDIAKWIEASSYSLITTPDPELDARLDHVISLLERAQGEDGYLNTYFTVVEPEGRWTDLRDAHELYCAGHLIEAAVAHKVATGKDSLLNVMRRYADYIGTVFGRGEGQLRGYDGHEEIELALVKLAGITGERRYLDLATYFVEERGQQPLFFDEETARRGTIGWFGEHFAGENHPGRLAEYQQAHVPVRDQHEAVGHAVRAMYLYSAMADLARENDDNSLLEACRTLWEHLTSTRMYVTGGIGTSPVNEGFTRDFDLPADTAYAETCAAIGLMMWAQRLLRIDRDRRYGDVMELALYNAVLAGMSEGGTEFFYDNPLASTGGVARHEWFEVACCPPNIARLLTSLGSYAFATSPDSATVHLFVAGAVRVGDTVVTVAADLPRSGNVTIDVTATDAPFTLALRIPGWSAGTVPVVRDASGAPSSEQGDVDETGYWSVTRTWADGDRVALELDMSVRRTWADPRVISEAQHVAVRRGPVVYTAEQVDNGASLQEVILPRDATFETAAVDDLPDAVALRTRAIRSQHPGDGLYRFEAPTLTDAELTLVPYYAWANRGAGEMRVWLGDRA